MTAFRYFLLLGPFFQVFLEVKKFLILELHEMIRVSHVVAWSIIFILLCDLSRHRGVLKLMKNDLF